MPYIDPVQENVDGVRQLVQSDLNKTYNSQGNGEGVIGPLEDVLTLKKTDEELVIMANKWEVAYRGYEEKVKTRQNWNLKYYLGRQNQGNSERDTVVPSNLIFEAEETFIPAALAKNPEPVVYPASNDPAGVILAKDVKTMLQYHADILVLRRKLAMMVRHWSVYFMGVVKHGWDDEIGDITTDMVMPQNLIMDENGTIDVYGNYTGKYLGEQKPTTAQDLIDLFEDEEHPELSLSSEKKAYIISSVDGKLGTPIVYTEWWTNEYCFYTYKTICLDKHKNQFWNYDKDAVGTDNSVKGRNHFGRPKMPYTFLSVFTLGKNPHDVTSLIEQNIPNQDLVNKRISQIDKNLDTANNSLAVSAENFNNETAKQAADAVVEGRPILVPRGKPIAEAIMRLPAEGFPDDAFDQLQDMSQRLRSIFGTLGISSAGIQKEDTVRGKIIEGDQDSSRIGGGIGDSLEQVADNIFNWWTQLYYVFYDQEHFAAVLGKDRAVEYITLRSADLSERLVVSVSPNSMKPKDEITEMNLATDRWANKSIDPIEYMKALNVPDPMDAAKKLVMWTTAPQQYIATYFPEVAAQQAPQTGSADQNVSQPDQSLSAPPANASLAQVPINNVSTPQ